MKKIVSSLLLFFIISSAYNPLSAQKQAEVEILTSGTKTSLRGLSVVNDNVVWVSGSRGMVGRSLNGGKNWKWVTVNGYEKTEFRDIEAFDANTALIMAIGEPAYILKTTDGGDTWKVVYENTTKGMFMDAMDFSDNQNGIVIGDPINGKPFIARTDNTGNTWTEVNAGAFNLAVDSGEAFFAASGTNVRLFANNDFFIVSGGRKSRLLTNKGTTPCHSCRAKKVPAPIPSTFLMRAFRINPVNT